jgi:cysteinyl-tRNA synthetase
MANVWMHNGFLQVEGEKMSKSLGNFVTIRQLLNDGWPGEVLRFNMLRTHYRQPLDWTLSGLEESAKILDEWYALASSLRSSASLVSEKPVVAQSIQAALSDDLNTPKAIAELHQLRNAAVHGKGVENLKSLIHSLRFLGFLSTTSDQWLSDKKKSRNIDSEKVDGLIAARNAARKAKDFAESDRIRDELTKMGVVLKDNKDGTTSWEVAR